ncbi:MAG TPA: hypothetical protein VF189_05650 [Patescibacteria group bacterium]
MYLYINTTKKDEIIDNTEEIENLLAKEENKIISYVLESGREWCWLN